ncbi:PDZ domain-containing protein [bacterium]|nr:MAG: PDZ domain-containing protein [bacterium]
MFWWAVSFVAQIPDDLRASVVTIQKDGRDFGQAVLVESGLYLATGSSVGSIKALTSEKKTITLRQVAVDELTQLVLLRGDANVPGIPLKILQPGQTGPIMVVGTQGVQRGQLVSTKRLGVVGAKRRYVPLSEVRVAGSVGDLKDSAFFQGRSLAGFVISVVDTPLVPTQQNTFGAQQANNYGPAPMSVVYVTGPDVMQRLLNAFHAGESKVTYPLLGIMCRDASGMGAEVASVTPGSAAATAGFRPGDIIVNFSGVLINNQFDFAQTLYRLKPGEKATVTLKRGDRTIIVSPTLGKSED